MSLLCGTKRQSSSSLFPASGWADKLSASVHPCNCSREACAGRCNSPTDPEGEIREKKKEREREAQHPFPNHKGKQQLCHAGPIYDFS